MISPLPLGEGQGEGGSTSLPLPSGEGRGEGKIINLTWDSENRLIKVAEGGTVIATYGYDPFGRRLWKDAKGVKTFFLYSDEGLIGEFDAAGNEIKSYGWKPGGTWGTDPVFMQKSGQYYFYHNDHLGTPRMMTSVTGSVVWKAEYEAFGKADVTVGVVDNNLRFPGQYFDAETGLHYNWNRYYEPGVGRYISEDPIGLEGGLNVYGYVKGDPLNWIDPWGLRVDKNLINQQTDPRDYKNAEAYEPPEASVGRYTLSGHGSMCSIVGPDNKPLDAQQIANLILKDQNFKGQEIELLSCETGLGTNPIGQQVADIINSDPRYGNVTVWAPDAVLRYNHETDIWGNTTVKGYTLDKNVQTQEPGRMKPFGPHNQ